jgi:hypothetical protein
VSPDGAIFLRNNLVEVRSLCSQHAELHGSLLFGHSTSCVLEKEGEAAQMDGVVEKKE